MAVVATMIPESGPHGGDGAAVAAALGLDPARVVDLSMSLNPFAPELGSVLVRHLDSARLYPDPRPAAAALAAALGRAPEQVALTNGGSEAIALVAAALGGSVASEPEFSLHPRGLPGPSWRSNPHNPTGLLAADDERHGVWDEAFYPLATGEWTRGDEGAVVVGSLTKLFACPGLRLGYVLADEASRLTSGQPAWPVSSLAVAALPDLLEQADLTGWCRRIADRRGELAALLARHGMVAASADAPWVLVESPGLRERLAPGGVVIRDCGSFGLHGLMRIAVPDDDQMERLAAALEATAEGPHQPATCGTGRARPGGDFERARRRIEPPDLDAERSAAELHRRLTKPAGSLGRIEALGIQLAAISGRVPPPVPAPAAVAVFAGDHGVVAEGVTPWPQEVTGQMVANFLAGGAAINALARQAGATVTVVDVGVASDLDAIGVRPPSALLRRRVRAGTANLATGPAMERSETIRALDVGAAVAAELVRAGAAVLVTGDMGIGNTTPSAALISRLLTLPAVEVTGRGTGIDDAMLARKVAVIERALARVPGDADPVTLLAEVGGLEIAALGGFIVGAAAQRVPVVVDGVIAGAALLVAHALAPDVLPYVVAGHRSTEPGATAVLAHLGLEPVLDLGLRLGEGSGACLALGLLEAAALVMAEMATFDSAGVSDKPTDP